MLKDIPATAGLEAAIQLGNVLGRIGNAAQAQDRDDAVDALGRNAPRRQRILDAQRHDFVHILEICGSDLGTQRIVDGRIRLDAVDARDPGSLAPRRHRDVGGIVRRREHRHPHAGTGTDLEDGSPDAGGGCLGCGDGFAVADALGVGC